MFINEELLLSLFTIENDRKPSLEDITYITIKSLIPNKTYNTVQVDYNRYRKELDLFKEYNRKSYDIFENIVTNKNDFRLYYKRFDDFAYLRIIPIILSNTDLEVILDEVIKNVLYFSGNIENLFTWIFYTIYIYNSNFEKQDLIKYMKDYFININQIKYFNKYKEYYKVPLRNITSYKIEFERVRLDIINLLNLNKSNNKILNELLNYDVKGKLKLDPIKVLYKEIDYNKLNKTQIALNDYILKLKLGKINREHLLIYNYVLPDIFKFNKGEKFYHSLLGNCIVIKKEVRNNILTSIVSGKMKVYEFRRDLI